MITKDLGAVSAYAYAVEKGYTGTEAEYAELMASYATVAQQASQSAQTAIEKAQQASASATSASQSASTASASATSAQASAQTATAKASEAQQSAQTATEKAQEASQSASTASQSASTAVQAKQDAQTAKTASETAQGIAESARDDAETARDEAQQYAESIDPENIFSAYPTDTASGAVATFPDGADDIPMKSCVVHIEPVQDLSHGDPSPDNICPISGWTGAQVTRTGKNLFDSNFSDYTKPYDYYIKPIKLESGKKYVIKAELVGTAVTGTAFGITKKGDKYSEFVPYIVVASSGAVYSFEFTVDDTFTSPKLAVYVSGQAKFDEVMSNYNITLEVKADQNNYEPYKGESVTIQLGQTVYGGTLDVTKGELVVTHAEVDMGTLCWNYASGNNPYFSAAVIGMKANPFTSANLYCSMYPTKPVSLSAFTFGIRYNGNAGSVIVKDPNYTDAAAFKTAMSGAQLCYELATPITYTLTPQEIASLLGTNNLWADTGDTSVTYRADTTLYIKRLTDSDTDMVADANIVSGQYFMIGNDLYKATANIASGASVIVGTNATKISLAQALNEINA